MFYDAKVEIYAQNAEENFAPILCKGDVIFPQRNAILRTAESTKSTARLELVANSKIIVADFHSPNATAIVPTPRIVSTKRGAPRN